MKAKEYIDNNFHFYHITPLANKESILMNGLLAKRCNGICVVRSDNPEVWKEIINGQLTYPDQYYLIIKLTPYKHEIKFEEVAFDSTEEDGTGPLQNYILKKRISIDESDIIKDAFDRGTRPDYNDIAGMVKSLSDYDHPPVPNVSVLNEINNR